MDTFVGGTLCFALLCLSFPPFLVQSLSPPFCLGMSRLVSLFPFPTLWLRPIHSQSMRPGSCTVSFSSLAIMRRPYTPLASLFPWVCFVLFA